MAGAGFEPAKAEPPDLQSGPFGHSGIPPKCLATAERQPILQIAFYKLQILVSKTNSTTNTLEPVKPLQQQSLNIPLQNIPNTRKAFQMTLRRISKLPRQRTTKSTEYRKLAVGFEPTTTGLQNRYSAVELR